MPVVCILRSFKALRPRPLGARGRHPPACEARRELLGEPPSVICLCFLGQVSYCELIFDVFTALVGGHAAPREPSASPLAAFAAFLLDRVLQDPPAGARQAPGFVTADGDGDLDLAVELAQQPFSTSTTWC